MMRALSAAALAFVMISLSLGEAVAHSPTTTGDNESLANAALVREPTKSWAIYSDIHKGGEARYYKLELKSGERLHAGIFLHSD